MKKINIFIGALLSVMAWTFSACSEDTISDNFGNSPAVPGQGVYFAKSLSTSVKLTGESGEFELPIQRTVTDGDVTVKLSTEMTQEAKAVLTIPSSVNFKNGEKETKLKISYQNAVQGTPYILKVTFEDGTEYANSTQTFRAEFPFPEVWKVVSTNATFIDQLFSPFEITDVAPFTNITVEKLEGGNKYRFLSPYDNNYIDYNLFGNEPQNILPGDFRSPYIVLDGILKTKPGEGQTIDDVLPEQAAYFIPPTAIGFYMNAAMEIHYDNDMSWPTFGSMAYTFVSEDEPGFANFPLGKYNKKQQMFEFGVCFNYVKGKGGYQAEGFQLWLDPTKMEIVYDRDYVWTPVPEATGTFVSGVQKDKWIQNIEKATVEAGEDPLYHFTSLYAPDVNIVFYHNKEKGIVRMPKKQKTGMTSFGNDVYVDMKKGSYNKDTKTYTFELFFYLMDKATDSKVELITTEEKFVVGYKAKIDDYVGEWKVFISGKEGPISITTSLTKKDDATLVLKGLAGDPDYDDAIDINYNQDNGTLTWGAQKMPDYGPYGIIATPWVTSGISAMKDVLTGWLNEKGQITFASAATNQNIIDSYAVLVLEEGQIIGFLAELADLTWERGLMEKPKAKVSFASPFRTYNTKLQYKPAAVTAVTKSLKSAFIGKKVTVPFRAID